ncbi:MAG: tetratricopeptide repeat protein [Proteobacteria bacterium]|nr:tetratricopeptide repeat protein [Pseudomonadota bacterium]
MFIPPTRPRLVPRPRLIEHLNEGLHRKLTLVSAPAGFGKTTLVTEWLDNMRLDAKNETQVVNRIAWLSLDEDDNDLARFLSYFIAALNQIEGIDATFGKGALSMLHSPQPQPTEAILTSLINELTAITVRIILVLDDYHLIDAQPIHDALTFLLEHQPPQMHLVIATRQDPHLPLARLRAADQLTELRATDLRFTSSEASEFLNQTMGLKLSAEDITALETRTEGWIAGLQLAAISLKGKEDATGLIKSFTGSHRLVLDYLIEEVLDQQPEDIQTFLLQTAILKRLNGSLCDALTGQDNSQATLEMLDRANLFIVPLDNERRWYRYHHLFADLLRARLWQSQPNTVATLHMRASEWFEKNGPAAEAVNHALAAEDFERAAGLVELAWPAMDRSFQSARWHGWVKALPDELIRARPVLSVDYAQTLMEAGELEASESRLRDAERWLEPTVDISDRPEGSLDGMVVVDKEQFRTLPARIAIARAYIAQSLGDVPGTVKYARRALGLFPEDDIFGRGIPAALLGMAYWASGDLEAAHRNLTDFMTNMRITGNIPFAISSTSVLADIRIVQGRLHEALSTYEQSLQLAVEQGEPILRGTAELYLGLSELHSEQGDIQAARQHLLRSEELGEQAGLPDWQHRWSLAQARIKEAQGDLEGALDLLQEAERYQHFRGPVPDVRPIAALKTRVWVRQGRLTEALGWARKRSLSVDDDLSYLREFEHVTLVRVLIAEYKSDQADRSIREAMGLLARLLKAAEEGRRVGSVIEILVLQALAHEAQDNIPLALAPLECALAMAEPEGFIRIFVDEGPPMTHLLYEALSRGIAPDYVQRLLAAFPTIEPEQADSSKIKASKTDLIEPLSEREIEVLQLIAEGLTNREIATRLYLSLNTVKVHTRNIYAKLDVHHRTGAVARARALGVLPST